MTKEQKRTLITLFVIYLVVGFIGISLQNRVAISPENFSPFFRSFFSPPSLEGVGTRWMVTFGKEKTFFNTINPMTVIMSYAIIFGLIIFASTVKFEIVPNKKQSLVEVLLEYFWELVEDAIPNEKFRKPTFTIAMTLFLFIFISNILSGIPGITSSVVDGKPVFGLFTDTWYVPTSDLNTNATYAVMVLIISHIFAIKAHGFWKWLKSFFEPTPVMFPLNVIGELAKPVSHSLRLFGNIMGGGILVLVISYMVKYFVMPIFLWGFFGMFVGTIQAFVFSLLAIAYIGSVL